MVALVVGAGVTGYVNRSPEMPLPPAPDKGNLDVQCYSDGVETAPDNRTIQINNITYRTDSSGHWNSEGIGGLSPGNYMVMATYQGESKTDTKKVYANQTSYVQLSWEITTLPSYSIPTWKVGNTWTLKAFINGSWYNVTYVLVGEQELLAHNCYVLKVTFEPDSSYASLGLHNDMKMWFDKASLRIVKLNATGELYGFPFVYTMTYSYKIEMTSGNAAWPREVGKSWTTITNTTTKVDITSPPIPGYLHYYNITTTWTNITAFERVTVPAGEFECLKMTVYNGTLAGNVLSTEWYSEQAERAVKSINYETEDTSELTYYVLAE